MFYINQIKYSIADLQLKSASFQASEAMEEWEISFWLFLKNWFDEDLEFIEVKTSGSTGTPKTIQHHKKYMKASAAMTCTFFELDKSKTALLCLAANTIGGMMMIVRALESGMDLIVQKPGSNPLENLENSVDFVAMVPMQVQQVFDSNNGLWKKVDTIIIGGGMVSKKLTIQIVAQKLNAFSTFGMSETISHIALSKIGFDKNYTTLEGVELKLSESDCLIINAPDLGINNLQTNDIVNLVSENTFEWLGRKDNAIESGGLKLLPEQIETKIAHCFSNSFFISAIPDDLLNNKLVLIIEGKTDFDLSVLKPFLSKYEMPKQVFYANDFIYTKNGKIDRSRTKKAILEA